MAESKEARELALIEKLAIKRPVLFARFEERSESQRLGRATMVMRSACVACFDLGSLTESVGCQGVELGGPGVEGAAIGALEMAAAMVGFVVAGWDWSQSVGGAWGLGARLERGAAREGESSQHGSLAARVAVGTTGWGEAVCPPQDVEEWAWMFASAREPMPWLAMIRRHGWEAQVSSALELRELRALMKGGVALESGPMAGRL